MQSLVRSMVRLALAAAVPMILATACSGDGDDAADPRPTAVESEIEGAGSGTDRGDGADPTTTADSGSSDQESSEAETVGFYDTTEVHDLEVEMDPADYEAMIATYTESGNKEWIEVDVTVDGIEYRQAGMRLKGNSSLFGLDGALPGAPGGGALPDFGSNDGEDPVVCAGDTADGLGAVAEGSPAPDPDFVPLGGPGGADDEHPEDLPWLISLDRFIADQNHAGEVDFVVRSNGSETALNEATALGLLDAAGLATQEAAAVRFSVNGSEPRLRLVIENPNGAWTDRELGDGSLFKADSTGDYSYRGGDPAAYTDAWDQDAKPNGATEDDYTPLIEFLDFVDDSTDEEFAAGLSDRLDIESFARYLAIEDLIGNFDDIDGPGNNSYLFFDAESGRATVVAWDHNLAFSAGGFPGGGFPGGAGEGCELREGFDPAELFGEDGPAGGAFGRSNLLVKRFKEVPVFQALYEEATTDLRSDLFDSGLAEETLQTWTDLLADSATDVVDTATIASEAKAVRDAFPGA